MRLAATQLVRLLTFWFLRLHLASQHEFAAIGYRHGDRRAVLLVDLHIGNLFDDFFVSTYYSTEYNVLACRGKQCSDNSYDERKRRTVPLRCGQSRNVMKNCDPLVLGPLLAMHSSLRKGHCLFDTSKQTVDATHPSESNGRVRSSSEKVPP